MLVFVILPVLLSCVGGQSNGMTYVGVCTFECAVRVPVVGPEYCGISSTLELLRICTANTRGIFWLLYCEYLRTRSISGFDTLWVLPVLEDLGVRYCGEF